MTECFSYAVGKKILPCLLFGLYSYALCLVSLVNTVQDGDHDVFEKFRVLNPNTKKNASVIIIFLLQYHDE